MIAHSLPYGEGFDAHFPLHCTTRQTSLSSVLVLHKTDHLHSPIQNDFQVFGARYFGGAVLCRERSNTWIWHAGDALLFAGILPNFSLTAVWYCSPPCCADCCSKHLPRGATKPRTLSHLTFLTCFLHAHELAQINSVNDDGAFWRAGRTTPVSVPGEGVHWEQRDVGSVAYMRGIFGDGAALQGWGCASAAHILLNWVQPIQEQFKGARSYEDEAKLQ